MHQVRDPNPSDSYGEQRTKMVTSQLRRRGIQDQRVLDSIERVPRHLFVPHEFRLQAYEDHPIPIGENQTISQPFIIALSLEALALTGGESVLEVGTGSGYQTAVLALLARMVYSVERYPTLAQGAEFLLAQLGFDNVRVLIGDGSHGLKDFAPFDAIVVSAAAPSLPKSLLEQLADGGRLVIPVGPPHAQELQLVRKQEGRLGVQVLEGCRFVPLVGSEGYQS